MQCKNKTKIYKNQTAFITVCVYNKYYHQKVQQQRSKNFL